MSTTQLGRLMQEAASHLTGGRPEAAERVVRQLLSAHPTHGEGLHLLGHIRAGQGDVATAVDCFKRAIQSNPRHLSARLDLAKLFFSSGRLAEVVETCRETIALLPKVAAPLNVLGAALTKMGQLDEATTVYQRAIRLDSHDAHLHHNLGNVLKLTGHPKAASEAFRRSLALGGSDALVPLMDQLRELCDWDKLAPIEVRVLAAVDGAADKKGGAPPQVTPFSLVISAASATQQRRAAERFCARSFAAVSARSHWDHSPRRGGKSGDKQAPDNKPLTIGYLSADFHQHATAYLAAELFELHDRGAFKVIGYSLGPDDGGPMRQRIEAAFDDFVDLREMGSPEAAARIYHDQVDILVDLKGHTQNSRPEILAMRPAPIQVNYLGFPGTMGADFVDYFIGDPFATPLSHQEHFSEKIVQLPDCYQINDRKRRIADTVPNRVACGLPDQGPVLCCFNHLYKISPAMFATWMDILTDLPDAVLWLLEGNANAMANLRVAARRHGVNPKRLVFAPKLPLDQHLARIPLGDLFLDTFPCNAHTTASDALWAGLPLVTRCGETFASRVAGSLLSAVGLSELICSDQDGYRQTILAVMRDPQRLADYRTRLQAARTDAPLFDSRRFCHHLESAYHAMWQVFQDGTAVDHITIPAHD